jgi:hypothetical protein
LGGVEGRGGAALMFARTRTRIEAAVPFPRIGVVGIAGTSPIWPGLIYDRHNRCLLCDHAVCTENFIRVDDAPESPKLAE